MDLKAVADRLREVEPGYWVATAPEPISYPEHGHGSCFELEDASFWFRHRNACVAAIAERYPPDGFIVDIGGGNGYVSLGLQRAGFETLLVEPGETGARNAYDRGLRPVAQASWESAGFLPESIAAAGLFDVVEHVSDDSEFLAAVHSALRSGGRLYLTVPAFPWLWSSEDVEAGHFRRYTRSSVTSLLEDSGFLVEFASYLFWMLPLPIFVKRSLAGKLGARERNRRDVTQREHQAPKGVGGAILDRLLLLELERIRQGAGMPFGSSVLVVARKP